MGILLTALSSPVTLSAQDVIPPTVPTNLIATVASCGQVNLSWGASTDEAGGSGLKAYIITRNDPGGEVFRQVTQTAIGAVRTTFSDTNYVRSSATLSYTVAAQDYAGNRSAASNVATVVTPLCPFRSYEQVLDSAYMEPLGKSIATYGTRTAVIYAKQNATLSGLDTWLYLRDEDTGRTSQFLLHPSPGYKQIETDYVLTSATELWALSFFPNGGNVFVSQYALNGSPIPTSATLVSTKSLGDSGSYAKSMIRLKSGALMVAWNQDHTTLPDGSVNAGFAYRSPAGSWSIKFPVNIPNPYGGNITWSRMSMAQHPADGSIWVFDKRDSAHELIALHFTETSGNLVLDWIQNGFISQTSDGANGPQTEFPFLSAVADPTRDVILLAYQTAQDRILFVDPLLNDMNGIFLKEATATVAQIRADGSKSFIPFPNYMERDAQFGFSSLADGTLWLMYQPINHQTLTWNEVYASNYSAGVWSAPALVGFNYNNYALSGNDSDPGVLGYRTDQPQVAFRTSDVKVHSFTMTAYVPPPLDTAPPTTSITSPADGGTVSGMVTVTVDASDNIGVTEVDLLVDGVVQGTKLSAPYSFSWDTSKSGIGKHTLQSVAYDSARNRGTSATIAETVANTIPLSVAITNPLDGATVPRNTMVTIAATATGNVGVAKVEFYVGNKLLATDTDSPYSTDWKIPNKPGASYTIQVIAYDATGNTASAKATVTTTK